MLLLHQQGSVKIGETVRYTVTYTPAHDRILPPPPHLHLRIKNTCAVALRAAFIHGPYTLYVSSSPSNYHPNKKFETYRRDGIPEFEPQLKAGGSWYSRLLIPEDIRATAGSARSSNQTHLEPETLPRKSVTWIIEVASQVLFSTSASVDYEILLGRDEKSLSLGLGSLAGNPNAMGLPGQVSDHQESQGAKDGHHSAQSRGVFSRAIRLRVDDTASLWNRPRLPEWDDEAKDRGKQNNADAPVESVTNNQNTEDVVDKHANEKQQKIHLVVLTHGLHSNLGADMLYLKESIDEAAKQAKEDAKIRRAKRKEEEAQKDPQDAEAHDEHHEQERKNESGETKAPAEQRRDNTDEDEDDEEVIVRGFSGNAVRTEKGIKYLGKRLAKWILTMTYPDQPYKPIHRSTSQSIAAAIKSDSNMNDHSGPAIHNHSDIHREPYKEKKLAYKITSISFIGHSLGGLIQIYAIAYIQKHSPNFFHTIKPVNFVALATPFLGLSNENPVYVKMALDFGFVGRTGQDLGLTWRAPTLARSGWGALVSGIGEKTHKDEQDPKSKPLLRILPTGPAHTALKKFRNRTLYSNVVNDGIVPLRTSCLLFLDWQGLGRVEKARRENGLMGTVTSWGWAELTGANVTDSVRRPWMDGELGEDETDLNSPTRHGMGSLVPQPSADAMKEDDNRSLKNYKTSQDQPRQNSQGGHDGNNSAPQSPTAGTSTATTTGPLDSFLGLFRSNTTSKPHNQSPKNTKIYRRSQTLLKMKDGASDTTSSTSGPSRVTEPPDDLEEMSAPPKTSIFESAGDIINPPLPPVSYLLDPSARPRTIFHDRVYHPDDIPPPPIRRKSTSLLTRRLSRQGSMSLSSPASSTNMSAEDAESVHSNKSLEVDGGAMKVEEKIARAYHKDLSWRKVLVRLEPDAHNNMMVRRRFANAYGWPVVKHLCDTHFSDSAEALMRDDEEDSLERAKDENEPPDASGGETKHSAKTRPKEGRHKDAEDGDVESHRFLGGKAQPSASPSHRRTDSELLEATDHVPPLNSLQPGSLAQVLNSSSEPDFNSISQRPPPRLNSPGLPRPGTQDSAQWSEADFMDSEGEDSDFDSENGLASPSASAAQKSQKKSSISKHGLPSPTLLSHHQHADEKRPGAGWNWETVIAGKGAVAGAATSPRAERRLKELEAKQNDVSVSASAAPGKGHIQAQGHDVHPSEAHPEPTATSPSSSPSKNRHSIGLSLGHRRKSSSESTPTKNKDKRHSSCSSSGPGSSPPAIAPLPPLVDTTAVGLGVGAGRSKSGSGAGLGDGEHGGDGGDGSEGVMERIARLSLDRGHRADAGGSGGATK